MKLLLSFWREAAIGLLIVTLLLCWNELGNKQKAIAQLNTDIAVLNDRMATDGKWVAATTDILKNVIEAQNEGIDRVLNSIEQSNTEISSSMAAVRAENAKRVDSLRTFISNMPTATTCEGLMDNLIKNGEAVKW